jgi:phosphoglycerate dehydrogenase-like enzyme
MTLRVHLQEEYDEDLVRGLRRLLRENVELTCGEELPQQAEFEILVCGVPDREAIEASAPLRHLVIPWAGLPRKTRELMREHPGISVHNIHHNAVPVAEMAITLLLAAAKDLGPVDKALRGGDWTRRYDSPTMLLLAGKQALILGFGAIGREIALRCRALGMEIAAVDPEAVAAADRGVVRAAGPDVRLHSPARLQDLLPSAHALFLSLPLTQDTEGMIRANELSMLPDRSILVNVSRGKIVDEDALYERLKSGRMRAGLDVWYSYPDSVEARSETPPSAHPFHELTNVVMTPHLAGHSDRTEALRAEHLARLLNLAAEGKPLPNRVDLEKGY